LNDLFSNFTDSQCEILFECILHAIESNSGIGFLRLDQAHPDYQDGAKQAPTPDTADDEENPMFQMMKELSLRMADIHPSLVHKKHLLTTWPEFCKKAVHSSENPTHKFIPLYER
jgi:hypothetical protein